MEKLHILRKPEEVQDLIKHLEAFKTVSVDTETTGLEESDEIVGLSVCADVDEAFYIIIKSWNVESQTLDTVVDIEHIKPLLLVLKEKKLILHNAIFDCKVIERCCGVSLIDSVSIDTFVLAHLLDENRSNSLKNLCASYFGEDATKEQQEMIASVIKNGGKVSFKKSGSIDDIEMYKADADILANYGAKDTLLTFNLAVELLDELDKDQRLWKFFFDDESMPLLRTVSYQMNTAGLKVDLDKLNKLEADLRFEILKLKESVYESIYPYVKDQYPGDNKKNKFNIGSPQQFSWLLFIRLEQEYKKLTPAGRTLAKQMLGKLPYTISAKKAFIKKLIEKGLKPEKYLCVDKSVLAQLKDKYKWLEDFLTYKKLDKMQNTYVKGIKSRIAYSIIRPKFNQCGTSSGRYSSEDPNFQNLPRDDKRIKECIVARPGKVFVGADYSQLEPRVFAYYSQDWALMKCFENGDDFYSIIGARVYGKEGLSLKKDEKDSFAKKYKNLRQNAKTIGLSATYGTTAYKMIDAVTTEDGKRMSIEECQNIIDTYFEEFPGVKALMDGSHREVVANGVVHNLYGRPRHIPEAKVLQKYGKFTHGNLDYSLRTLLNLAVNHRIQSTGASIINRSAIALHDALKIHYPTAKIVLQVHDSLVVECDEKDAEGVAKLTKECMENTCNLEGVKLEAEPQIGKNLGEV